jgi:streptogramin lyase
LHFAGRGSQFPYQFLFFQELFSTPGKGRQTRIKKTLNGDTAFRAATHFNSGRLNSEAVMTQHTSRSNRKTRYTRALRHLEPLEPRTLLSASVTSYTLYGAAVGCGAYDSSGDLWVYDSGSLERIKNSAVDTAPGSVISLGTYAPWALATGLNNHIYAADWSGYGAIVDINTKTGSVTATDFTASGETPIALTVSGDGTVWCVGAGMKDTEGAQVNVIGVLPLNATTATFTTFSSYGDSQASLISANGNSVWIAMGGVQVGSQPPGTNRVAAASWDGSAIALTAYDVAVPGSDAGANGLLNGLVADADGSVWFTLSNNPSDTGHTTHAPDQIVHGVLTVIGTTSSFTQTAYIDTATSVGNPLNYGNLALDADGNVWFAEFAGNRLGLLNPADGTFSSQPNPTAFPFYQVATNANGTQISYLNEAEWVYDELGNLTSFNTPIIQIDIPTTPVSFSGTASSFTVQEDTSIISALNGAPLAVFVAPTPVASYSAVITWGDGTTSNVEVNDQGGNMYVIYAPDKSFATQRSYACSIAISDGASPTGTLDFTANVTDVQLNVTSFSATSLFFRIVAVTGSFTDDADLPTSTWTATVNWGDGTSSRGIIVRDPAQSGRYFVIALHQYRSRGTYTASLTVTTSEANASVLNSTLSTTVTAR